MCALLPLLSENGEVARSCYWVDGVIGDRRAGAAGTRQRLPVPRTVGIDDHRAPSLWQHGVGSRNSSVVERDRTDRDVPRVPREHTVKPPMTG
jgi:hypothetical protein